MMLHSWVSRKDCLLSAGCHDQHCAVTPESSLWEQGLTLFLSDRSIITRRHLKDNSKPNDCSSLALGSHSRLQYGFITLCIT